MITLIYFSLDINNEFRRKTLKKSFFFQTSTGLPKTDLFFNSEKVNNCSKGEYLCHYDGYCINIQMICDGISHCYHGDDELDCGRLSIQSTEIADLNLK